MPERSGAARRARDAQTLARPRCGRGRRSASAVRRAQPAVAAAARPGRPPRPGRRSGPRSGGSLGRPRRPGRRPGPARRPGPPCGPASRTRAAPSPRTATTGPRTRRSARSPRGRSGSGRRPVGGRGLLGEQHVRPVHRDRAARAASLGTAIRRVSSRPSRRSIGAGRLSDRCTWPTTVTWPVGAGGTTGAATAPPSGAGTQPRSTSTAVPSARTSGVTISKPTSPSTVRPAGLDLVCRVVPAGHGDLCPGQRPCRGTRPAVPAAVGLASTEVSGTAGVGVGGVDAGVDGAAFLVPVQLPVAEQHHDHRGGHGERRGGQPARGQQEPVHAPRLPGCRSAARRSRVGCDVRQSMITCAAVFRILGGAIDDRPAPPGRERALVGARQDRDRRRSARRAARRGASRRPASRSGRTTPTPRTSVWPPAAPAATSTRAWSARSASRRSSRTARPGRSSR